MLPTSFKAYSKRVYKMASFTLKLSRAIKITSLISFIVLFSGISAAAITYVSVTSTLNNIPHDKSSTLFLQWRVTKSGVSADSVRSSLGRFVSSADGRILGNNMFRLEKNISPNSHTVMFSETLTVPKNVVLQAIDLNLSSIVYERLFDDGRGRSKGFVSLRIKNPSINVLAVRRMLLSFVDGSVQQKINRGQKITALAQIWLSRAGLVNGQWMIAEEGMQDAKLEFKKIAAISKFVEVAGPFVIKSPELPNHKSGRFLVKLDIDGSESTKDSPLIRYIVTK